MTLVADVRDRVDDQVAALKGAVEEVADLAELVRQGALPQRATAAYVVPIGFNGGRPEVIAGLYRQSFQPTIGVVLVVQTPGDPKAKRALAAVDAIEEALLEALCGWAPAGAIGEFYAVRGRLISVAAGTVFYQIDFAIENQLRIMT